MSRVTLSAQNNKFVKDLVLYKLQPHKRLKEVLLGKKEKTTTIKAKVKAHFMRTYTQQNISINKYIGVPHFCGNIHFCLLYTSDAADE